MKTPTTTIDCGDERVFRIVHANPACQWRAQTFWDKEPVTIEWLDGLGPDDVLFDVGANIGLYSMYAAVKTGCKVYAFEPESQNFGLLCYHIYVNNLVGRIVPYCLGISDARSKVMGDLNLTTWGLGGSCHQVNTMLNFSATKVIHSPFKQGCVALDLGTIASSLDVQPTAIKVDVDGIEPEVVDGALYMIPPPRTWIIETNWNREDHKKMVSAMEGRGYKWSKRQANKAKRKEGAFKNVGETIFFRPE